ncbi:MAG: alpha/beta hydrolase-fold protein [Thermodesulfobacteriota bacterium]
MADRQLEFLEVNPKSKPSAAVIWLHGLGVDGHDFEPIVPELRLPESLPVRFVFPHAPKRTVTVNFHMLMPAWFDILDITGSHKVNVDDILESSRQLADLVQAEIRRGLPPERIILAGFSQGGVIALHTGLRYNKKLAGIMALSTFLPTIDQLADECSEANRDIPIFMAHGTGDPLVGIENAVHTRQALNRLGYHVRWREYPVAHTVCHEEIQDIRAWILDILG